MSNSLQWLAKHNQIIILLLSLNAILLCTPYVSSFEFGVSPSELNFQGKTDEKICQKASVFSSIDKINISLEDRWTNDEKANKIIDKYILNKEALYIKMTYERNFILNKEKEIDICLISKYSGNFRGILFFEAINGSLSIGIWLNADISSNIKTNKITGFSVLNSEDYNLIKIPLIVTAFNLFLLLGLMFIYLKRKDKRSK